MPRLFHYTYSAAPGAPTTLLHHHHVFRTPINSSSSIGKNFTAPTPRLGSIPPAQNGTGIGNFTMTNTTMVIASGSLNGTSAVDASYTPTYSDSYGAQVNFTIWLLTALSALFLVLRVCCKAFRHRGLWWDDYIMIASWLSLTTACVFISYTVALGFPRPLNDFDARALVPFLLCSNLAATFSVLAALWSKTSFAITVLDICGSGTKKFVWFIIISVNVALALSVALIWAQCMPVEKVYNPSVPGECWPQVYQIRYQVFTSAYSGVMDILLAVVPWKIIWSLTMNKKEKCAVLVAMSMGIFAGITSIIKITTFPGIGDSGYTDAMTQLVILSMAEGAIIIMAASIPALRTLTRGRRRLHLAPPLPPAVPVEFFHAVDMYTGTTGAPGTGRTSTVITSSHASVSRASTRWSRDFSESGTAGGSGGGGAAHGSGLLSLRRWSQASRSQASYHRRASSATSAWSQQQQMMETHPPPGRILTTEEVVVEYEKNDVWIGRAF